ncbi:MAG: HAD family hydrolase [Bacteroidota bacterium]
MQNGQEVIFWDWNGTLLNDVDICIEAMNMLLNRRGMSVLDAKHYKDVFTFPVMDYYRKLGFDFEKEAFEIPAIEFIDEYKCRLANAMLFDDVFDTLQYFHKKGYRQFVVSAMENEALATSIEERGISHFFEKIVGLSDDYAHGKLHLAEELIRIIDVPSDRILMIGDTLHDYEISKGLGVGIFLIDRGHQSRERLMETKAKVLRNLSSLMEIEQI